MNNELNTGLTNQHSTTLPGVLYVGEASQNFKAPETETKASLARSALYKLAEEASANPDVSIYVKAELWSLLESLDNTIGLLPSEPDA